MLNLSSKTSTGTRAHCNSLAGHLHRKHHVSGNHPIDKPAGFLYSAPPALQTARKRNLLMARRTVLVDDFDESEATQTVEFRYRGRQYAIDLNNEHAEEFDSLLSRYVEAARDITQPAAQQSPTRRERPSRRRSAQETARIREWARNHDMKVSDRGRIPLHVLEQYDLAKSRGDVS